MNKLDEDFILQKFRSNYAYFPEGHLRHIDKPDFIIEGLQKIGIEITQVFHDQNEPTGSTIKARNTFHYHISANVLEKLVQTNFPKCIFALYLNESKYSRNLNSRQIADLCHLSILSKKDQVQKFGFYEFENTGNMPEVIEGFSIYTSDQITEISFSISGSMTGESLRTDDIQFILNKKENSKCEFEKCDLYWLVIEEGTGEADYFGTCSIESNLLETTFDKVFLQRQRNSELIELK